MFGLWKKKVQLSPVQKEIISYVRPSLFTPDRIPMEEYNSRLLFVADDWMKDRKQNFVLDDIGAIRHGKAFTLGRFNYRTYDGANYDQQHVNVALKVFNAQEGFRIMGEVVEITNPSLHFTMLDKLRLNTVQLMRQRVILAMPYRDGPIVFENTTEERTPHVTMRGGIDWLTGKFPHNHPLGGKKYWLGPEKIAYIRAFMYVGIDKYWKRYVKTPFHFSSIPTFKPKKNKWWLTEYYKYQNPKE